MVRTDLKKGQYYRFYYYNKSYYIVGKCKNDNSYDCDYAASDMKKTNRKNNYWNESHFTACTSLDFATQEEINWLEQCHLANEHVPFIENKELIIEIW